MKKWEAAAGQGKYKGKLNGGRGIRKTEGHCTVLSIPRWQAHRLRQGCTCRAQGGSYTGGRLPAAMGRRAARQGASRSPHLCA